MDVCRKVSPSRRADLQAPEGAPWRRGSYPRPHYVTHTDGRPSMRKRALRGRIPGQTAVANHLALHLEVEKPQPPLGARGRNPRKMKMKTTVALAPRGVSQRPANLHPARLAPNSK